MKLFKAHNHELVGGGATEVGGQSISIKLQSCFTNICASKLKSTQKASDNPGTLESSSFVLGSTVLAISDGQFSP